MTTFDESKHNRSGTGEFAPKAHEAVDVDLSAGTGRPLDWTSEDFTAPGFYHYTYGGGHADGPYETLEQMVEALDMDDYPSDGGVAQFDGETISMVSSMDPDLFKSSGNYTDQDVSGESFKDQNLNDADFTRAIANKSDFSSTYLIGATFTGGEFRGSDFSGAQMNDSYCHSADFGEAVLTNTDLTDATLIEADFKGADLRGANFTATDLTDADFSGANIDGADFLGAIVTEDSFANTDTSGAIGLDF